MHKKTGLRITGLEHIRQSVTDILLTPVGSRLMRRDYGSLLPDLIDQPLTDVTRLQSYAAVAIALTQWEPRIRVNAITHVAGHQPSAMQLSIDCIRLDTGTPERAQLSVTLTGQPI